MSPSWLCTREWQLVRRPPSHHTVDVQQRGASARIKHHHGQLDATSLVHSQLQTEPFSCFVSAAASCKT